MRILIEHGHGPVTVLVARGVQVEVELTADIQAALDAGLIRQIKPAKPPKPVKAVHGAMTPTVDPQAVSDDPQGSERPLTDESP